MSLQVIPGFLPFNREKRCIFSLIALLFMLESTSASVCSSITQSLLASTVSQYLESPNYPSHYPTGKTCVWRITAPSDNYLIKIQFTVFDLQYNFGSCSSTDDSLEIRDGYSSSSNLISIYCQNNSPGLNKGIYSSGRYFYLKFKSDYSLSSDRGFQILFTAFSKVTTCSSSHSDDQNANIMLGGSSGIIKSPNYPLNYPNRIKCIWRIKLSSNTDIANISFTSFELENRFSSSSSSCNTLYDYLEIYDGYNETNGVSLGQFCQSNAPPHIYTRGNKLTVVFMSDFSSTDKGFSASYSSVSSSGVRGSCSSSNVKNNIYIDNSGGVIASPNYPGNYPSNMDCTWMINVSSGKGVKLYFLGTFKFESNCAFDYDDYVQIRDGSSSTSKLLGRFCGSSKPEPILTSGSSATVQFKTDSGIQNEGFYLVYEGVYETNVQYEGYCSPYVPSQTFKLTNTSGTIMSPNYPNNYPKNIECIWKISVRDGKRVKFVVEDMYLEWSSGCYKDYVQVRNGYDSYSSVLKSCCGHSACEDSAIYSTDRYMWIKFRSDSSIVYSKGFKATFNEAEKSASVGMIVGIVIGVVLFIVIVIGIVFCCYKCNRNTGAAASSASRNVTAMQQPRAQPQVTYPIQPPPQGGHQQAGYPQGRYPLGGYPQGGFSPSGSQPGGYPQSGLQQTGNPQGGYPPSGLQQGGYPQSGLQQGGYSQGGYPQGGYPQSQQAVAYAPAQKNYPPSGQSSYPAPPPQENYPQQDLPPPPPYPGQVTPSAPPQYPPEGQSYPLQSSQETKGQPPVST